MVKYRRFAAIHFASHMNIVWCPGCHCGVLPSAADAAAAIARRQSAPPQVQLPPLPSRRPSNSSWWGLWAGMWRASATSPIADTSTGTGTDIDTGKIAGTGTAVGTGTGTSTGMSLSATGAAMEGGDGRDAVAAAAEAVAGKSTSNCIGCPGCQASLCMSCKALHEPGVDCDDHARAMVDDLTEAKSEAGDGGGGGATTSMLGRSQGGGGQKQGSESTKRCPRCHVPIFKDGGWWVRGQVRRQFCRRERYIYVSRACGTRVSSEPCCGGGVFILCFP